VLSTGLPSAGWMSGTTVRRTWALFMMHPIRSEGPPAASSTKSGRYSLALLASLILCLLGLLLEDQAEAKHRHVQRPQPDLKILSISSSPAAYSTQTGPLDFSIEVELPKDLDGATILEVSSLISSPSKRSMRFLSTRRPVGTQGQSSSSAVQAAEAQLGVKPRMAVTLTWDGTDQSRQLVDRGRYHYEVRAKLLAAGEKGPRTQMVSWPMRGVVEVK